MNEEIGFKLAVMTTILLAPIGITAGFLILFIPMLMIECTLGYIREKFFPTEREIRERKLMERYGNMKFDKLGDDNDR